VHNNNKLIQLDHDLLESYVESLGVDIVTKMLALYNQQVVIYLADIEQSLQGNSTDLWQAHCHKMKGAAASIGLKSVHARLMLMEKTTVGKTEKAQQLTELTDHNQQALVKFNVWLESIIS